MASGFEQRYQNDLQGLQWIERFGWLRSLELGRLIWPNDQYGRTRADRVIRGWLARRLVIARRLPDGAGRAVVLSEAGARLLRDVRVTEAQSGKNWGRMLSDGSWLPNREWKHDLKAVGVLSLRYEDGFDIMPEREIQRSVANLTKVPDGLFWEPDTGRTFWLEVEQSEKHGKALNALAEALVAVSAGQGPVICGHQPTVPVVAYDLNAKDYRGACLNHRKTVGNAIRRIAKRDVQMRWCECEMSGHSVVVVRIEMDCIRADLASRILAVLNTSEWQLQDGCFVAQYGKRRAIVWEDPEHGGWGYCLDEQPALIADNKSEAMRCCAGLLAVQSNAVP